MVKTFKFVFWISLIVIACFWHPFKQEKKFFIYKLTNYELNNTYQQYLLLKKSQTDIIYHDMDIQGPFSSLINAHHKISEKYNDKHSRELHYLPIVRKHYAN